MPHSDLGTNRLTVLGARRAVQGIKQLTDRNRRWNVRARPGIGAREDHDQPLAGRHDRVQQQLAIFASYVVVADPFVVADDVVAIGFGSSRKHAIVNPEQTDDPMRYRSHRQHGADGQGAGTKVRSTGPSAKRVAQQLRDLGKVQHDVIGLFGAQTKITELAVCVTELPCVAR